MTSIIASTETAMAGVSGGEGGYLHVRLDGRAFTHSEEHVVVWTVLGSDAQVIGTGIDMTVPVGLHDDVPVQALSSLISFLLACAESESEESENYRLFETPVREWAEMNSDELQMLQLELEEESTPQRHLSGYHLPRR
jgi:hypothetical protein